MNISELVSDYKKYRPDYVELEQEIFLVVKKVITDNKDSVDVAARTRRTKSITSIKKNLEEGKYEAPKYKNILDIKDVAGVRITCHCEDDQEYIVTLLEGVLKQKGYEDVTSELKEGSNNTGKSRPSYRAFHINCSKVKSGKKFIAEIQIRTVMADAWAVQDRKYVYGKQGGGDAHDLTDAVSEIMRGCDKLWSLVKKKSLSEEETSKIKSSIKNKIKKIEKVLVNTESLQPPNLAPWIKKHFDISNKKLTSIGFKTYMQIAVNPPGGVNPVSAKKILEHASNSTIRTFGWPIGLILHNEDRPKPDSDGDGIYAEIISNIHGSSKDELLRKSYDYWALTKEGGFFTLKSIFEDNRDPEKIFFDTRIVRITESLMYIRNLYTLLGVNPGAKFSVQISHVGINGRILSAASHRRHIWDHQTTGSEVKTEIDTSLSELNDNIVDVVEKFTSPLFEQFDFFELDKKILDDIVTNFVNGKMV